MAKKPLRNVGDGKFPLSSQKFVAFLKSSRKTQPIRPVRCVLAHKPECWLMLMPRNSRERQPLTTDFRKGFGSNVQPSVSDGQLWDPKNFLTLLSGQRKCCYGDVPRVCPIWALQHSPGPDRCWPQRVSPIACTEMRRGWKHSKAEESWKEKKLFSIWLPFNYIAGRHKEDGARLWWCTRRAPKVMDANGNRDTSWRSDETCFP